MKKISTLTFLLATLITINVMGQTLIPWSSTNVIISGRTDESNTDYVSFGYSGVRIITRFEGTSLKMRISSPEKENYLLCIIDDSIQDKIHLATSTSEVILASGLADKTHKVEVIKITESLQGLCKFYGFTLDAGKTLQQPDALPDRRIHFIGNSITCGYGIEVLDKNLHFEAATENFYDAYAALTARTLDAEWNIVSRSGIGMYRNYGEPVAGSTNCMYNIYNQTFYDKASPLWDYSRFQPHVVCVNLGTNDFSESKGDTALFAANYRKFLDTLRLNYPATKIVILAGPMYNNLIYVNLLKKLVSARNAAGDTQCWFFELSAQDGSLGYGADWHPSRAQARKNANELASFLAKITGWQSMANLQATAVSADGKTISVMFSDTLVSNSKTDEIHLTINNIPVKCSNAIDATDPRMVKIKLDQRVMQTDTIKIQYSADTLQTINGKKVMRFLSVPVTNTVKETIIKTAKLQSPGTVIEASFNKNVGYVNASALQLTNDAQASLVIDSAKVKSGYKYIVQIFVHNAIEAGDSIYISYSSRAIAGTDSIYATPLSESLKVETAYTTNVSETSSGTGLFYVYPNPSASGTFSLSPAFHAKGITSVSVVSATGLAIPSSFNQNDLTVKLQSTIAGGSLCFVVIVTKNESLVCKIII